MTVMEVYKLRANLLMELMEYESASCEKLYKFVSDNIDNFRQCRIYFDGPPSRNRTQILKVCTDEEWKKIVKLINRYKEYSSQILLEKKIKQAEEMVDKYDKHRPILSIREFCNQNNINLNLFLGNVDFLREHAADSRVFLEYCAIIKDMSSNDFIAKLKRLLRNVNLIQYDGIVTVVEDCGLSFETFSSVVSDVKVLEKYFTSQQIDQIFRIYNNYSYVKQPILEIERKKIDAVILIFDKVLPVLDSRYLSEACSLFACDNGDRLTVEYFKKEILPLIKKKDSNRYSRYQRALAAGEEFRNKEIISGLRNILDVSDDLLSYSDEELFNYINSMYPDSYRIPFVSARGGKLYVLGEFTDEEKEVLEVLRERYLDYKKKIKRKRLS